MLLKKVERIFHNITHTLDLLHIPGLEVIDNLTVQISNSREPYVKFNVFLVGMKLVNGSIIEANSVHQRDLMDYKQFDPVKSIMVAYFGRSDYDTKKCWISFSYLRPYWRDFQFKLATMEIHFYPVPSWMPPGMFKELLFSFHSPNTLPDIDWENYQSLSTDKIHEIYYN